MKKILLLILALFLLAAPALAEGLPLVVDDASLLTQSEFGELAEKAQALSGQYGMDVVILTTDSIGTKTALNYAADWFDGNGYGQGADNDGVMLLISMEYRDWCILTTGRGIAAFTNYGINQISADIVPYFTDGDYANGFSRFLRDADIVLKQAESGAPYDVNNRLQLKSLSERILGVLPYLGIAALVIALVVLIVMIVRMNTARPQRDAGRYVRDDSFAVERAMDIYLYHTQTRVKVEKKSSSGGGSSTFRSSSGASHGGGSGKF